MARTKILDNDIHATNTIEYSDEMSAPSNSGQIIIDVREDEFTENMKRGLAGILFTMYIKLDGVVDYIPVKDRSYIWSSKADLSMIITDTPKSFYFGVQPIIDKYYDMTEYTSASETTYDSSKKYYTRSGQGTIPSPYVYTLKTDVTAENFDALKNSLYIGEEITTLPVELYFDNEGASSGGGSEPVKETPVLLATDWDSDSSSPDYKSQTISVEGVTATNTIFVSPATDSYDDYGSANIRATEQAEGTLKFVCDTIPSVDINVNIVILG